MNLLILEQLVYLIEVNKMTLNERINALEALVVELQNKVKDLSANTEQKYKAPISIVGGGRDRAVIHPVDFITGKGQEFGGGVIWNDSEMALPPANAEPATPTKGYNKHAHSRFSGGALINDVVEVVEFDLSGISNPHCQQYWQAEPSIAKDINAEGETVEKIGTIDFVFNPDRLTWGCSAYEIDVRKCYLVERDADGNIATDSKGNEKKSLLYNADSTKTSIEWDENAQCWRFYAIYAS